MIRIIKPGKYHVVTCPVCKCEFSYEDEDIKWGDQRDPYKEVECPCCKNRIDLYKIILGIDKEPDEKDKLKDDLIKVFAPEQTKDVLDKIKEEIKQVSFTHYFEYGEYQGEDARQKRIVDFDAVMQIIDKYRGGNNQDGQ